MIFKILGRALKVVAKKPFRLWGISLLAELLTAVALFAFGGVIGIAIGIILLISVGNTMVFLHGYRGEQVEALQLFDAFRGKDTVKRVLIGMLWKELWVFLWGLIPFAGPVFAIIKTYQYRLTPYILVQEPEVNPTDAMKISKERTKGYVGKMFLTDLLIVGAVYVTAFVLMLLGLIPYVGVLFMIILVLTMIVVGAILPLVTGLVQAAYYEEITNPTIEVKAEPQAAPAQGEVKFCPQCGNPTAKDALFCTRCGYRFPDDLVVNDAPAPETPAPEAPKGE
ncbi:MAG: hypothetical protein IK088_04190 [Lachnospiraceae bacterium]|nr:hypothetical protein [Lachnospiraceae bacterium]